MAFDWLISGYLSLCVLVWLGIDYTLRALICLSMVHVWLILFIGDVHMLIILIDSLTYFYIVTLLVVWLSYFPWHVYSHSSCHDWFSLLYNILFVSTYCLFYYIPILLIIFMLSLWYEWYTCYLHDCSSSMWCLHYLSMWDTHLSSYLQLPCLGRPCFLQSCIWYKTCYFVCSSTELVIQSRV